MVIIPDMDNSQLDIRQYDWFELFRNSLDEEDRKELDAFAARVNEHRAAIAVAGYDFPEYVVMLSFMLEEHKDLNRLQRVRISLKSHSKTEHGAQRAGKMRGQDNCTSSVRHGPNCS